MRRPASVKGSGPAITVAGGMKDHVLSLRNDPASPR